MAKTSKAVKPDRFFSNLPAFLGEKEVKKGELADEEKILGTGANTAFWKTLKDFIEEVSRNLDEVNEVAISQGANYEEVGKNTIVISLAKGIIKKIIDRVEDAREACEQSGRKGE